MKNYLQEIKDKNILCEIYNDKSDSSKFFLGYIIAYDERVMIVENISSNGVHDGYYCLPLESIFRICWDTVYIRNFVKLLAGKDFKRGNLKLDVKNLLSGFLAQIKSSKILCNVELYNDELSELTGYLEDADEVNLLVNLINTDGLSDGKALIRLEDISCVSIDTEYLNKIKAFCS